MSEFIAPGLPGGPPYQRRGPVGRRLYLPTPLRQRLEADARLQNPISQFIRAHAALYWRLPSQEWRDEAKRS